MKILIDGSLYLFAPEGGAFQYLNELLPRVSTKAQVEVLTPRGISQPLNVPVSQKQEILPTAPWFPEGKLKRNLSKLRRQAEAQLWSFRLFRKEPTLFHTLTHGASPRKDIPLLVTILDVAHEKFPRIFSSPNDELFRERRRVSVRAASRFIAISKNSKEDFCTLFGISEEKVDVAHLGVDMNTFGVEMENSQKSFVRTKHQLTRPFLLQVGGRLRHKNFSNLLVAFSEGNFSTEMDLICAGHIFTEAENRLIAKLGLTQTVRVIERPQTEDLRYLYGMSDAFVYPSLYEGFGLPLLEAMAGGTLIAASNRGSIPEVGGAVCQYFDPENPTAMSRVIQGLLNSPNRTERLAAGKSRAAAFTWDKTAQATIRSYQKTLMLNKA